jgi:hypothetical protein
MKKFAFLITLVLLAGMTTLYGQQMQVGTFSADKASVKGYSLDAGSGERTVVIEVNFDKLFDTKPTVLLSVNAIDADKDANLRFDVKASAISRDGFTINIRSWADSKIYYISGTWMAYSSK